MEKKKNYKFGIHAINELEYSYTNPFNKIKNFDPDKEPLEVKVGVRYKWNLEKDLFIVFLDIIYGKQEKDNRFTQLLKLSISVEYIVNKLKDLFHVRTNTDFEMDEILETSLVSIAISTARGILYEKNSGNIYRLFILPLINPKDVILSMKRTNEQINKTL